MIAIADYFLSPLNTKRELKDVNGKVAKTFEFIIDGFSGSCPKYKLREYNPGDGSWMCDWLLRVEADRSITEYGDEYPPSRLDWPRSMARLIFTDGHEIRWTEDARGTLRPNLLQSTPSKYGSFGSYLVKALLQPNKQGVIDENADITIYMEQTFKRTDRCLYRCKKGYGITEITYYADNGTSATIAETPLIA